MLKNEGIKTHKKMMENPRLLRRRVSVSVGDKVINNNERVKYGEKKTNKVKAYYIWSAVVIRGREGGYSFMRTIVLVRTYVRRE